MAVRNHLIKLISDKQTRDARRITVAEISRETGISRQTLHQYLNNDLILDSFKAVTIERLCRFFECNVGDLLYVDFGTQQSSEAQQ